jgi:hypothetical protein
MRYVTSQVYSRRQHGYLEGVNLLTDVLQCRDGVAFSLAAELGLSPYSPTYGLSVARPSWRSTRGFQFGNRESGAREIKDELYWEQNGIGFMFRSGKSISISQAEINRVIQTVRRMDDQSSGSKTTRAQPVN